MIKPRVLTAHWFLPVALFLSMMLAFSPAAFSQDSAQVQIGSRTLNSDTTQGIRATRVDFSPESTGSHTIRVSWDNDADIRFRLLRVVDNPESNNREVLATFTGPSNPKIWTGDLSSSDQYFLTVWAESGTATFTATLQANEVVAVPLDPAAIQIGSRALNSDTTQGIRATRVDFSPESTGSHTIRVVWNNDADIRFRLLRVVDNPATNNVERLATFTGPANPKVWTGNLNSSDQYFLTVWAESGSATFIATLQANEVDDPPQPLTITAQPADLTVTDGDAATFTVVATGSGELGYQWFVGTSGIEGETSDTLTIDPATLTDSGAVYSVVIDDGNETLSSDSATLTVEAAPEPLTITAQPADLTVTEGDIATFTVAATGSGELSYEWYAGTTAIEGATSDTLTIDSAALSDSGTEYSVVIDDANGTIISGAATLTVEEAPEPLTITAQPSDLTVTEGDIATFTVAATGSGELNYQWFVDSTPIEGATSDTLTISSATLADNGTGYSVVVGDDNGSIDSAIAILVVEQSITIPTTVISLAEGTLDFDRIAGPRWVRHNFKGLVTGTHTVTVAWDSDADIRFQVFEANGTRLTDSPVQGSNPGIWSGELIENEDYYIAVFSSSGIANYTASVEAAVPLSIERHPENRIVTEGERATFIAEAAGSGQFSYQWFFNGTELPGETADTLTLATTVLSENGNLYSVQVSNGLESLTSDTATLTVNPPLVLGLFSQEADTTTWMLHGPAPTLDFRASDTSIGWGRVLLRVGDLLLVGGDFEGIKPTRSGPVTDRPWLATLNAVTGQPESTFQVPPQIDSVVRALALSPNGEQLYVGGDFGLLVLDAATGAVEVDVSVMERGKIGRVFDIAVSDTQLYIGGDFNRVQDTFRANIARLSLDGELDSSWSPNVTNGFSSGRAAPVMSITLSPADDLVYIGGNYGRIGSVDVDKTPAGKNISLLAVSAVDETVQPQRFSAEIGDNDKALQALDVAVTDSYVIVAWGGPNYLTFHSLAGDRLKQYNAKGDVQALQVIGDHVFVGHHGEFFGFLNNPIPQEAVVSLDPQILDPYKFHSFRIDDPTFPPEQAWQIGGAFGIWGIAAGEDGIWLAGQMFSAGSNERVIDGLVRFPALDQ